MSAGIKVATEDVAEGDAGLVGLRLVPGQGDEWLGLAGQLHGDHAVGPDDQRSLRLIPVLQDTHQLVGPAPLAARLVHDALVDEP